MIEFEYYDVDRLTASGVVDLDADNAKRIIRLFVLPYGKATVNGEDVVVNGAVVTDQSTGRSVWVGSEVTS